MARKRVGIGHIEREREDDFFEQKFCSVAAIAGVAAVGGSLISADAAGDASDAQQQSSQQSNALQRYMFDQNVALNAPALNTGNAARDRLSFLLGLSGSGYSGSAATGTAGSTNPNAPLNYDQLRAQLLPQFTTSSNGANAAQFGTVGADGRVVQPSAAQLATMSPIQRAAWEQAGQTGESPLGAAQVYQEGQGPGYYVDNQNGMGGGKTWVSTQPGTNSNSQIDETGLDAMIRDRLRQQQEAADAREAGLRADPEFGSLARGFQFDTYTPGVYTAPEAYVPDKFSYTGEDLYNDPSYLFRLQQGQKAVDRQGAAAGRFLSGAQLQATSDYNQGAASQEFQSAYQRALGTFGTNEGNRAQAYNTNTTNGLNAFNTNESNRFNSFNTNETNRFNASQANFSNTLNPLLSLAGAGQTAAQFLGSSGMQTAQTIGNTLTNQANATGAAGISAANSINSGVSGAINSYQQNQLLNNVLNRNNPTVGINNNPYVSDGLSGLLAGNNAYGTAGGNY